VADALFQQILDEYPPQASAQTSKLYMSFPSMKNQDHLVNLSKVLCTQKCRHLLGLKEAEAGLYPSAPAPYICIEFADPCFQERQASESKNQGDKWQAKSSTEDWINNFLGKYRLCPYTSSVTRAAVGLSSVNVPVGQVHVSVVETDRNQLRVAKLISAFWSEVVLLIQPSQKIATSLVVFPEYDEEFEAFVDVCDNIIEPTVAATQSTDFIGRAWFHPGYEADAVGHTDVIAGHAVPHRMVELFYAKSLNSSKHTESQLDYDAIAKANDKVRHTPHATINILRRSQLLAAGEYEKSLGDKKPRANSIYVRNALRIASVMNRNIP